MLERLSVEKNKKKLLKVYKAIKITKKKLNANTSLIGFVGAPLTISFFMLDSKREKNYKKILSFLKKRRRTKEKVF